MKTLSEQLLLLITDTWKKALDSGHKVGVIFIYFRKAFDCVDHSILCDKLLSAAGIWGNLWK